MCVERKFDEYGIELLISKDYVSDINVYASFKLVFKIIWILLVLSELDLSISKLSKKVKFKLVYVLDLSGNKFWVRRGNTEVYKVNI